MKNLSYLFLLIFFFSCESKPSSTQSKNVIKDIKKQYLFVGTYTKKEGHVDGKGKGIYQISYDSATKNITDESIESQSFEAINPSYISIAPNHKILYAAHELNPNDGDSGTVGAYRIDEKTKDLHFINSQKSHGFAPCHVSVDATNTLAIACNYVGGVVSVFPIQKNGGLAPAIQVLKFSGKSVTDRQEASHPHSSTISPDNKYVFFADLGTDKIKSYRIDLKKHKLLPTDQGFVKTQDGAGPRHFAFHPNGKIAYVVNELDATVNVFDYDSKDGSLQQKQSVSTLPEGFEGDNWCADIHVHPNGKFLLASNRGHNSLAVFKINEETGMIELIATPSTEGDFPRNFAIAPSGKTVWVANQNTDNVVQFEINTETGDLKKIGEIEVPTPVCLKFL